MSFVPVLAPQREPVDPADWGPLRDFIHERTGVFYSDPRLSLMVARLEPRLASRDAHGAQDLLLRLKFDESGDELRALQDLATPHESSFLRESEHLDALAQELWATRPAGSGPFRIWSAGCAAGQEAYSIRYRLGAAFGASEPGRRGADEVELIGTDLSPRCIAEARRGEYRDNALRGVAPADRDRLVQEIPGGRLSVRPEWRQAVRFEVHNLLEPPPRWCAGVHVVFCRNVLIYFSESSRRVVVESFYECLRDGGFLFLGHAESLHGITRAFRPVTFRRGLAYQKD